MFKTRRSRVLFSAVLGALIAEFFRVWTGGKLEINFLFLAIPINYIILGILYFQNYYEFSEKKNASADDLLDSDLD